MPNVTAHVERYGLSDIGWQLKMACWEVVPAALHVQEVPDARLTPGSIIFTVDSVNSELEHIGADVLITVEAYHFDERDPAAQRAEEIRIALKELFPRLTFRVWVNLGNFGWSSDTSDPDFDGDMTMAAALERAKGALSYKGYGRR